MPCSGYRAGPDLWFTSTIAHEESESIMGHSHLCDPAGQVRPGVLGHWSTALKGNKCGRGQKEGLKVRVGEGSQAP